MFTDRYTYLPCKIVIHPTLLLSKSWEGEEMLYWYIQPHEEQRIA